MVDVWEKSSSSRTNRQSLLVSYSVFAIFITIGHPLCNSPDYVNLLNYVTVDTDDPTLFFRPAYSKICKNLLYVLFSLCRINSYTDIQPDTAEELTQMMIHEESDSALLSEIEVWGNTRRSRSRRTVNLLDVGVHPS